MKQLIIHQNNIPFTVSSIQAIEFRITTNDIDKYISEKIIKQIKDSEPEIIFIKDNLSANYLELYGLRVAYHIRLSEKELGVKHLVPIVILSDIDGYTLSKFDPIVARILFTKNVFIEPNNKESIEKYRTKVISEFKENEFKKEFLNLIQIDPPENSTSHSIANKWAIDRWARFLKVDCEAITENKEKISSMLYIKYLLALNPIEESKAIEYKRPKLSGKILFIDDEWDKGWSDIFKSYFDKTKEITFETFEKDFNSTNIFSLRAEMEEKIISYAPDVILLDLRLSANDTERTDIEKFTGIKVRDMIKEINPAIQVIMFTATSKSRILEELYKHKILGYIKKEDPQEKNIKTKESFTKLSELVDRGLEKKYLKEVWNIQNIILDLAIVKKDDFKPMIFEIRSVFEILDSDMNKRYIYAMLSIFQSLEEINNHYINDRTGRWLDTNEEIGTKSYTKTKILKILHDRLMLTNFNKDIDKIAKMRKNAIHPPQSKNNIQQPTKIDIEHWFKMLQTILTAVDSQQAKL